MVILGIAILIITARLNECSLIKSKNNALARLYLNNLNNPLENAQFLREITHALSHGFYFMMNEFLEIVIVKLLLVSGV
jgi:hypothetical protein